MPLISGPVITIDKAIELGVLDGAEALRRDSADEPWKALYPADIPAKKPKVIEKREGQVQMETKHWSGSVKDELGGEDKKPAKKISHIVHRKSHNGDHIFEHHHTHHDHPMEVHTKRGDDEMVEHMLAHAGTPNPGEDEADAGTPDAMASAGATPAQMVQGGGASQVQGV